MSDARLVLDHDEVCWAAKKSVAGHDTPEEARWRAEPVLGEVLAGLEAALARQAAVRASVLARFDAAGCHDRDGYQNSSSWLRDKAGMTGPAARRAVRQMRMR